MSGHVLTSWSKYRFSTPAVVDVPLGQVLASGFYGTAPTVLAVDVAGRLIALIYGKDGVTQREVAVDSSGRIIMVPYGTTTIQGTATVTQAEKDREVQGSDGATLRTLAVDASGRLIMVPRGQSGNYLDVDAAGYLTSVMKGLEGATLHTVGVDASGNLIAVAKGSDGANLVTLKVDASGQLVMVPRGQSGNYLNVDAAGYLTSVMKGLEGATLHTVGVDASGNLIAVAKGSDGAALATLKVDASGQLIMVPRGQSGNYLDVDTSGFLTSVMKGVDGVTLRTVAVDAAGKILGVLQGDYAGALKTLAVDSQGRMLAVLTDPEDIFGNPNYLGAAELAARLFSPDTFDRRGSVLFMDSFENGLGKWVTITTGTGATVTLYVATARTGAFSVKLLTSAVNGEETGIERYTPVSILKQFGVEGSLIFPAADCYVILYLYAYTGALVYTAKVRYRISTGVMSYWDTNGNWQNLSGTVSSYQGGVGFSSIKLVINPTTQKYNRVMLSGRVLDMSTIFLQMAANTTAPCLYTSLRVAAQDSEAVAVPIDDVIITQNEP